MTDDAQNADHLAVMVAVEKAVRDVFEKRYAGRTMTYEQSRELVLLERSLMEYIDTAVWSVLGDEP